AVSARSAVERSRRGEQQNGAGGRDPSPAGAPGEIRPESGEGDALGGFLGFRRDEEQRGGEISGDRPEAGAALREGDRGERRRPEEKDERRGLRVEAVERRHVPDIGEREDGEDARGDRGAGPDLSRRSP